MYHFDDTVEISAPIELVYNYFFAAEKWPQFLPHVVNATVQTNAEGEQLLTLETKAGGQVVKTRSIRRCTPYTEITFSQITMPTWMTTHDGVWSFAPHREGMTVTVKHTIEIDEKRLDEISGRPSCIADAYTTVSTMLANNSHTTMLAIKALAEHDQR